MPLASAQMLPDWIAQKLGKDVINSAITTEKQVIITIKPENLLSICQLLYTNEEVYFDLLSCITGIDNGKTAGTMEVVYQLYSIPYHLSCMLKVVLARPAAAAEELPIIPSVSHIWRTANWHEREAYDLVGIYFEGHPDLRRILLPADWQGHPLRKDYVAQESYHGIQVAY